MLRLNRISKLVLPVTALVFMLRLVGATAWTQSGAETAIEHSDRVFFRIGKE